MTGASILQDKTSIAARLRADPAVHLYEIGDLDEFFFASCTYYAHPRTNATVLLYDGSDPPTLLALARGASDDLTELLLAIADRLPDVVYAHLAVGLCERVAVRFEHGRPERHAKLALTTPRPPSGSASHACEPVHPGDLDGVMELYRASYPDTWFVPRMLATGAYFGVREAGAWTAVAGVHVLSRSQRVAVLGNVATRPDRRGRGLARAACAAVIRSIERDVDLVGLNVAADNAPAIACYRSLGFEPVSLYDEVTLRKR